MPTQTKQALDAVGDVGVLIALLVQAQESEDFADQLTASQERHIVTCLIPAQTMPIITTDFMTNAKSAPLTHHPKNAQAISIIIAGPPLAADIGRIDTIANNISCGLQTIAGIIQQDQPKEERTEPNCSEHQLRHYFPEYFNAIGMPQVHIPLQATENAYKNATYTEALIRSIGGLTQKETDLAAHIMRRMTPAKQQYNMAGILIQAEKPHEPRYLQQASKIALAITHDIWKTSRSKRAATLADIA